MPQLRPPVRKLDYPAELAAAWRQLIAPRTADAPTVISTFAGGGGSSSGYHMAGFHELLAVEWDDHAVQTLRANYPKLDIYHGDIAKLSVGEVLARTGLQVGALDVFDGSPPCFPAGVLVETTSGAKPIEKVKVGDKVLTHKDRWRTVTETFERDYTGSLYEVRAGQVTVACTPEHPFYSKARLAGGADWVAASHLVAGQLVYVRGPFDFYWQPVDGVQSIGRHRLKVYNLEVEQDHSYTANGVAVHNCQGFSLAGKRNLDDDRNQLFREYVRLIRGLQPKVIVMENVKGMVVGKMKLLFAEILQELRGAGYDVRARLLNAMYFGVPQARERMIFIGVRNDLGVPASHPKPQTRPISVVDALRGLDPKADPTYAEAVRLQKYEVAKWVARCRPGESASKYHPRGSFFNAARVPRHKPSQTIPKTGGFSEASLCHHTELRYLTRSELKRLGSFPDPYIIEGTLQQAYNRIGNSVPPLMIRAIALHIRENILD